MYALSKVSFTNFSINVIHTHFTYSYGKLSKYVMSFLK
jgi:hypothetical protein